MSSIPRRKRLNKKGRLQAAKKWIPTYNGKNLVRGYRNWFGVSLPCAIRELELLGHEIDPKYKEEIMRLEEAKRRNAEQRKNQKEEEEIVAKFPYSDEYHFFVVGYTSNGASYGITWEEYYQENKDDDLEDWCFLDDLPETDNDDSDNTDTEIFF